MDYTVHQEKHACSQLFCTDAKFIIPIKPSFLEPLAIPVKVNCVVIGNFILLLCTDTLRLK